MVKFMLIYWQKILALLIILHFYIYPFLNSHIQVWIFCDIIKLILIINIQYIVKFVALMPDFWLSLLVQD